MAKCIWCGDKLSNSSGRLFCNGSCKSSYYQYIREQAQTRKFNKNPGKYIKNMLKQTVPIMHTREEKIQRRIDNKYGILYEINDNVEIPSHHRMLTKFYDEILTKIKNLKPGNNFMIVIKESKTTIPSIKLNISNHIRTKIPFKDKLSIFRRKNCLYIIREKKNEKRNTPKKNNKTTS